MAKNLFVKGAWLVSLDKELSEKEFIAKAGKEELMKFRQFPYVSLVLDNPDKPLLIGHNNGRTIMLTLHSHNHSLFQTMEWK